MRRLLMALAGRYLMRYMTDPNKRSGNIMSDAGNLFRLIGAVALLIPGLIFGGIALYQWLNHGTDHAVWATVSSIFGLIFLLPAIRLLAARQRSKRRAQFSGPYTRIK